MSISAASISEVSAQISSALLVTSMSVVPFDFGVRLGLILIAQAAALSVLAVTCVLAYLAVSL